MAKSPSVTIIERDMSTYSVTSSDTILAVVGYATKGPIGQATVVTSFKEFREKFGYPTAIGFSSIAISKAFNQGNQVIFYRVAETTGPDAAAEAKKVITNDIPFLAGYTELSKTADILSGTPGYINSEIYDFKVNDGTAERNFYVNAPSSGRWTINDIFNQIASQTGATSGFQEYSNSAINPVAATYSFKLSLNGTPVSEGMNVIIDVTSADTIDTVKSKIETALTGGSRGHSQILFKTVADGDPLIITGNTAIGLTGSSIFNFGIALDANAGGSPTFTTVVINGITPTTTYTELTSKINNAFVSNNINAIAVLASDGLYFLSKTRGIASKAKIDYGSDLTGSGKGVPLFGSSNSTTYIRSEALPPSADPYYMEGEAGIIVYPNENHVVKVEINEYTKRLRFVSSATGATSAVSLTPGTIGRDLSNILGDLKLPINGRAASALTVTKDTVSRKIRISRNGSTSAPVVTDTDGAETLRFIAFFGKDVGVTGNEAKSTSETDIISFSSKEKGTSTDKIVVEKASVTNPIDNTVSHSIKVYYDNNLKETFDDISLSETSDKYFVNIINDTVENGGSSLVSVEAYDNDNDNVIKFNNGTYTLGKADVSTEVAYDDAHSTLGTYHYKPGKDGIPTNGGEGLFVDALSGESDLLNADYFNYHILITPDNNEQTVQNAALALAESRKDFVYLIDPPFGLTYDQVKDWHNGAGYGRDSAVASSYGIVYWPWLKTYDSFNKKYVWCPPSVFMAEKLMEIDRVYAPWYAPAGDARGKIIADDVETVVSFAQREQLYGDFNCVNSIVDFASKGLVVFGQKTALRENKATNRVNVRRMIVRIKKLIKTALDSMLFEPHNPASWNRASDLINAILEPIKQDNGIEQYRVIIDGSINTPDVIAQNLMKGIIKIIPTNTIEIIEINLNLYKNGAKLDE